MHSGSLASLGVVSAPRQAEPTPTPAPVLELVVPVYNEAHVLDRSVRRLRTYLDQHVEPTVRLTIADNGSTDGTRLIAEQVAAELDGVRVLHLAGKGRGGALRAAWTASDAAIVGYTDVDLSTDPVALGPMLAAITSGRYDLAVATRLHADAHITRRFARDVLSRGYNLLLKAVLGARFSEPLDARSCTHNCNGNGNETAA